MINRDFLYEEKDRVSKNQLRNRAKAHRKTDTKHAKGWFVNPNAGNVEYNVAFFNNAMNANTVAVDAGANVSAGVAENLDKNAVDKDSSKVYNKNENLKMQESKTNIVIEEDIEKHDELNPVLFEDNKLKEDVREAIQKIVTTFIDELSEEEIAILLKDIILVGSNVSYNYTKDSDLDVHLIVDSEVLDCSKELLNKLYSAYRTIFNKNYDIKIKDIPVEIYVELDNLGAAKSNGVYSVLDDKWIKEPVAENIPELDTKAFKKLFDEWQDKYFKLLEKHSNNKKLTAEDIKKFIADIYELRKTGIADTGEFDIKNLVFKEFRNLGYLDTLKELRKELKGKELSLEHLEEDFVKLEKSTPYMLRNDGKLLECGEIHPYIYYNAFNTAEEELTSLLNNQNFIKWFYNNTNKKEVKENISSLLYSILECDELEHLHTRAQELINELNIEKNKQTIKDKSQIFDIFYQLNQDTNQEFCRVRVSSLKFGGDSKEVYFRISSLGFNWFDLIWNIVMNNKDFVENITIVKDTQTFGGAYNPYVVNNKKIEHMSTEEFLTLQGNPVIEKFKFEKEVLNDLSEKLYKGQIVSESLWYMHPRYANKWHDVYRKESLQWDMNNILQPTQKLNEELIKNNAAKLYKLLDADTKKLIIMLSADTDNREIINKNSYDNAVNTISKGIHAKGMWNSIEQSLSYVIKGNFKTAKELAKDLCQKEFITIKFDSDNEMTAKVYRTYDKDYKNYRKVQETNKVIFDNINDKDGWTEIDDVKFQLGLYDASKRDVIKNLTESKSNILK